MVKDRKGNFHADVARGNVGEDEFINFCEYAGWNCKDVSGDETYQDMDIDFVVKDSNGKSRSIEVKWDYRINETNNFFIETVSNMRINSKGWIHKTDADIIFYGDAIGRVFYCFKPGDMLDYCKNHNPRSIDWYNKEVGCTVKGYLVDLFEYQEKGYRFISITLP